MKHQKKNQWAKDKVEVLTWSEQQKGKKIIIIIIF